jgi:hypothetical protein
MAISMAYPEPIRKRIIDKIYSFESLPTEMISTILKSEFVINKAFHYHQPAATYSLLEEFFADPSRSSKYCLDEAHAQLALWSLTTLMGDPSKPVGNQFSQDVAGYGAQHSICVYHLSHASVSSPLLVNFPTIHPGNLRDEDCGHWHDLFLNKSVTRLLLVCKYRICSHTWFLIQYLIIRRTARHMNSIFSTNKLVKKSYTSIYWTFTATIIKVYASSSWSF